MMQNNLLFIIIIKIEIYEKQIKLGVSRAVHNLGCWKKLRNLYDFYSAG